MKLQRMRATTGIGFNMTPMVDIVFLLIIFFMTVSQITRVSQQAVQIPVVAEAEAAVEQPALMIWLDEQGDWFLEGQPLALDQLRSLLQSQGDKASTATAAPRVHLRCDRRCPSESVNRLVEQLDRAGVPRVVISVIESR